MTDRDAWFQKMPGLLLFSEEKAMLDRVFENRRGNDLLQIGGPDDPRLIENARVFRTFFLDTKKHAHHSKPFIQASIDCLPIQSESMDIVLCTHQLEMAKNPKDILQEVYRILRPNGQLIIVGLNRFSLWQLLSRENNQMKLHSVAKIKRYLRKTNFDILMHETGCFRPPFKNIEMAKSFLFLETLGQFFLPYAGAVYMLVATKNIPGMTPLLVSNFQSARV